MRGGAVLALALFAAATPAAAQTAEENYRAGVEARLAGRNDRAIELLRQTIAVEPRNADAQLQLGLALMAAGRLDEAEAALRRTLELAPDYADATEALARLEQRRSAPPTAAAAAAEGAHWRLDLDGSYSDLEGALPDWKEASVRLGYRAAPATWITGAIEHARRFGLKDTYGELRLDTRFSDAATGYALFGATPNADFRPEWQLGLGGSYRVTPGPNPIVLTLDARQARYRSGDIQTLNPGVEQYLASGRAWLTARWINIFDEDGNHQSGWLARGDVLANDRLRLFAGAADAPDTSEGVVVETFSLFGGFAWDVSDRSTLRASLAHEDRETGSDRLQFSLGMGWRF